jgi:hypothetical protein
MYFFDILLATPVWLGVGGGGGVGTTKLLRYISTS